VTRQRFPFFSHRTLREVARTEALIAKSDARQKFTHDERSEFGLLIKKARAHNPPPPDRDAVA
jgi:hypothetical protein